MSEYFLIRLTNAWFIYTEPIIIISESSLKVENRDQLHDCLVGLQSSGSAALSFEVAVLFVKWGVIEEISLAILHKVLHGSSPAAQSLVSYHYEVLPLFSAKRFYGTRTSSQALTCLVSYCHCYSSEVISSAMDQLHKLIDWKVCLDTLSKSVE